MYDQCGRILILIFSFTDFRREKARPTWRKEMKSLKELIKSVNNVSHFIFHNLSKDEVYAVLDKIDLTEISCLLCVFATHGYSNDGSLELKACDMIKTDSSLLLSEIVQKLRKKTENTSAQNPTPCVLLIQACRNDSEKGKLRTEFCDLQKWLPRHYLVCYSCHFSKPTEVAEETDTLITNFCDSFLSCDTTLTNVIAKAIYREYEIQHQSVVQNNSCFVSRLEDDLRIQKKGN